MLRDQITYLKSSFKEHTELRAQVNTRRAVTLLGGNLVSNLRSEDSGCSARVYIGGVYGFASGAEYSKESVQKVLKAAHENAVFMDS
ncbi:MAG: TldD/PmbA family protein, partial [Clostridiaceae bacterium]|nr:TldD/PmbA family protein [Clostridiaceae bacterium]